MIVSLVAMIGLEKCCITSACLQWLCHSGERIVARGPLVIISGCYNNETVGESSVGNKTLLQGLLQIQVG